ncbi:malto-oligosyltrehalose trehalohydrolase [Serinibacter salmoneus]|uniref:Malto-oligosyltrehalose trehalohydrolase n=1 Tax=Serinibacter salmoneus TaxID=556530 RepID=A0A2A9CZM1_9MICO|nr:malto-oligosyltrehalose trehalohydrolase [Serinibacter salmoneus]PFG19576.1 maltooligosyl trehalose hydrolase [Serinibacter salmoneus]
MTAISVWAPTASEVTLVTGDTETPMVPEADGWFRGPVLDPGTDYAFRLDGGDARPDPRSRWQPHGVHAASRVFDPSAHAWRDGSWAGRDARGAVTYELHVGTFTPGGTLHAAIERLDHLVDLGIEVVELMPLAAFNGPRGWGYDGVALWAVHEAYGGPAALQAFVDAAHARGLAVCLDVVHNHLGPSGNYLGEFGPYFTDAHETPWGSAVNLDQPGSREVREFLIGSALSWLRDFHVDALRLDAVHALVDDSPRHVLAELADRVADLAEEVGRPLTLIAESDLNDVIMVTPTAEGGRGMQAQWADDVHHALHAWLTGERAGYYVDFGSGEVMAKALTEVFVHDGGYSTFRGRDWGRPVGDVPRDRFVVFAANHDQIGNRATGDRPSASLSPGRVAAAAALVLCSPFTPMLFMGEEWAASTPFQFFTSHPEPDLGRAVTQGRRREFASHGWTSDVEVPDPQDPATFQRSVLRWQERSTGMHSRVLAWHRDLIMLRRDLAALRSNGAHDTRVSVSGPVLLMERGQGAECVQVAVNLGEEVVHLEGLLLLGWDANALGREARSGVDLAPDGVAVLRGAALAD